MASHDDIDQIDETASSGDPRIQGLLGEFHWNTAGRQNFRFTIPDSETDYEDTRDGLIADYPDDVHEAVFAMPAPVVTAIFRSVANFDDVVPFAFNFEANNDVDTQLRYGIADFSDADIDDPDGTYAYAYMPEEDGPFFDTSNWISGDVFLKKGPFETATALVGSKQNFAILHETGHALGLKHGHETDDETDRPPLPGNWDSQEFSVMTYREYIGDDLDSVGSDTRPGNFAQTLMMLDIAALQHLYGADYNTRSGNTIYRWDPANGAYSINGVRQWTPEANVVFLTVWDGDGIDTYDFLSYTTNLVVNLNPGGWSNLGTQRAVLKADASGNPTQTARGNVFNALLYLEDERSLIENAISGSGNDSITGNIADNALTGGAGADTLIGFIGDDTLSGGAGGDILQGSTGIDFAAYTATTGENVTITPFGAEVDGRWRVTGSAQAAGDILGGIEGFIFGSGNDTITVARDPVGQHVAVVNAGAGNDVMNGSDEADTLIGGAGSDTLRPNEGPFEVFGGAPGAVPDSWVEKLSDKDLLVIDRSGYGGSYAFTIVFTPSPLDTFGGSDGSTARGIARFDYTGSKFIDLVEGARGADTLRGFGGDDDFEGGSGNDLLDGGTRNDFLIGGRGNDTLLGGSGTDFLDGGAGNDRIEPGTGGDFSVYGNSGNDTLIGSKDGEGFFGGSGKDLVRGFAGEDNLFGAAGNDTLDGGEGADLMTGGPGRDVFVFAPKGARDDVTDFDANPAGGQDRLDVSAYNFKSFADMLASGVTITGTSFTLIDLGDTEINIAGVSPGSFGKADFIF